MYRNKLDNNGYATSNYYVDLSLSLKYDLSFMTITYQKYYTHDRVVQTVLLCGATYDQTVQSNCMIGSK